MIYLLDQKGKKPLEKRVEIVEALYTRETTIEDIQALKYVLEDKKMALVLEAMEAATNKNPAIAERGWLFFAQDFIVSESNNLKREASRIVGNIAHLFPDDLSAAIEYLLSNTKDKGTVVRWGSAYALARIIQIPQYAGGELYNTLIDLSEREQESGVKNQLLGGLKKAKKYRHCGCTIP